MATPPPAAVPPSGATDKEDYSRVADALYNWCRKNGQVGDVFNQKQLLDADIIPNKDIQILVHTAQHLVNNHLFKIHDVKTAAGSAIGWELVSSARAANFKNLHPDEHIIYSIIDNAGSAGIWTKNIKTRSNINSKVADKVIKTLENANLIKSMSSVKYPGRKMYIVAGLTPSEEATGGAWFTDGTLDKELVDIVSDTIESMVSQNSWRDVTEKVEASLGLGHGQKRKALHDGFDVKGKGKAKASKLDDHQPRSETSEPEARPPKSKPKIVAPKSYLPYDAGHKDYLTTANISNEINRMRLVRTTLPQNAIEQLLEVMVYDERLYKLFREPRNGEHPVTEDGKVTMFKTYLNSQQVAAKHKMKRQAKSENWNTRATALRLQELEDIGNGGATEVPCLSCPVLHLCGDGGPVNVESCGYFDTWYSRMEKADREMEIDDFQAELSREAEES